MNFIDAAPVEGARLTSDGYLVADARIVRTGIQHYAGFEVGKPDMPIVRVYRPESEVFHRDSLASFSHIPITDDHPSEKVTADNWAKLAKGETGDEVLRDGHRLRIPLIVKDAAAVQTIQAGKRELSAGYSCDLAFEDGVTEDGEAYDAVQRNIRANHLAIVQRGRAGTECRIGDGAVSWGAAPITDADTQEGHMADALRKVMVDGLQVETTDAGAAAIEKLTKDKQAVETRLADANTAHAAALADKDKDLATKDAEIDDLKGKQMDDAKLDKLVSDRADLIGRAKAVIADVDTAGKSIADIRRSVVAKKLGDAAVKDKSDDYVEARFDILADAAKPADGVRDVIRDGVKTQTITADEDKAYAASISDLNRQTEAA